MIEFLIMCQAAIAARCHRHVLACKATADASTAVVWHTLIKLVLG